MYQKDFTKEAFKKVQDQLQKSPYVTLTANDDNNNYTFELHGRIMNTSIDKCNCDFFITFGLPCRHVFATRKLMQLNLYDKNLFLPRWSKDQFKNSHPALNSKIIEEENESVIENITYHMQEFEINSGLTTPQKSSCVKPIISKLTEHLISSSDSIISLRKELIIKLLSCWENNKIINIVEYNSKAASEEAEIVRILPKIQVTPKGNRYQKSTISFDKKISTPSKKMQNRRLVKNVMVKLLNASVTGVSKKEFFIRKELLEKIENIWAEGRDLNINC